MALLGFVDGQRPPKTTAFRSTLASSSHIRHQATSVSVTSMMSPHNQVGVSSNR